MRAFYAFLIAIAALSAMPRNADAQLYVTQLPSFPVGIVSEYDATTAVAINPNFITGLKNNPFGLALSGNTLFVANAGTSSSNGTVGKYDANTER